MSGGYGRSEGYPRSCMFKKQSLVTFNMREILENTDLVCVRYSKFRCPRTKTDDMNDLNYPANKRM